MKNPRHWIIVALVVLLAVVGLFYARHIPQNGEVTTGGACTNQCGNGRCEEMVCLAVGCPCAETSESCPQDCKAAQP